MEDDVAIPSNLSQSRGGENDDDDKDVDMIQTADTKGEDKQPIKLEDLFADVPSDDEFSSSAPVAQPAASSSPSAEATPT